MNKILLSCLALVATFATQAQTVNIPDPVFKNYLVNHSYSTNPTGIGTTIYLDANHDGQIQYSEAASYTSNIFNHGFQLAWLNITSLTGIEAFQSIEYLNVDGNQLTALDVSGCLSLKTLICSANLFTTLTINNPSIQTIECNNSQNLTALDASGCPALKKVTTQLNPNLAGINVNGCGFLEEFRVNYNAVLTDLEMGSHSQLRLFQCYNNALTSIDVSLCPGLQHFYCSGNPLTSLNLANGNPQSFIQIVANNLPDLSCIKVDNVTVSEFLWEGGYPYEFDQWASFNTDCTPQGPCVVAIPDAHFKTKLLDNTAINTNGNNEIECAEAEAYTGAINVDNADISDMTGIEAFKNISALSCDNNNYWQLRSLNVSGFAALTSLSCTGNGQMETLDVSGCTALTHFAVDTGTNGGNLLDVDAANCTALTGFEVTAWGGVALNLNGCTALTGLTLSDKQLRSLDVSGCSALTSLNCNNNALTALPLNGCTALVNLNCSNNNIAALSVSGNQALTQLDCSRNALATLHVLDNVNLTTLNCSENALPYLMVSNNAALTQLNCSKNSINYLDVNNNPMLTTLDCSHNNLSALNVNNNTALLTLNVAHNNIGTQNISNNTTLTSLYCENNHLTSIDMSNNAALKTLYCASNELPALDLSHTPELLQLDCGGNLLTGIDVSVTPLLVRLDCKQNQLTTLDMSNTACRILACESNPLVSLNLANGNSNAMIMVSAYDNPALSCIQVDDAAYSTANWTTNLFVFDSGVGFSENCALGTHEANGNTGFVAYPNPTRDVVYFSRAINAQLYNCIGQLIAEKHDTDALDLSQQPTGVYFITGTDGEGRMLQRVKVVKQ